MATKAASALALAVAAACGAWASAAANNSKLVNITTYRVTPKHYTGITNMDSGNAAGDVMFGLNQLLLPQLCAVEPSFLWCENRKYLSGGDAWMVYSEFVVTTRDVFGEYQPCNPCQGQEPKHGGGGGSGGDFVYCEPGMPNGTFVCESEGGGSRGPPPPPQCESGFDIWHEDCLNGTVYKTLKGLDPKVSEGTCCAACSGDKQCRGWNMAHGLNSTACELMTDPIVMWDGGQEKSSCKAAVVDHSSYNCWYDNPQWKKTLAPFCSKAQCKCDVIEKSKAVGLEADAMCHNYRAQRAMNQPGPTKSMAGVALARSRKSNALKAFAAVMAGEAATPDYWHCSNTLEGMCFDGYMPSKDCTACANDAAHKPVLMAAGCTEDMIGHLCHANLDSCEDAVDHTCKQGKQGSSCDACILNHTSVMENANCTETFVNYFCHSGHRHHSAWYEFVGNLACLLEGNWYSTNEAGKCEGKELTDDCWWFVAEEKRTVNQTCVDENVIKSVQTVRPDCWTDCPDNQGKNVSSACFLKCLFNTMLGNSTEGVKPMTKAQITHPFTQSFKSSNPAKGGCVSV